MPRPPRKSPTAKRKEIENSIQREIVRQVRLMIEAGHPIRMNKFCLEDLHGRPDLMAKAKTEGAESDWSDLILISPDAPVLMLEVKKLDGSLSDGQKKLKALVEDWQHVIYVDVYSLREAMETISGWLNISWNYRATNSIKS